MFKDANVISTSPAAVLVGQYLGYHLHVAADHKAAAHEVKTTVPTAASVTLTSSHPRSAAP
jgi:alpha-acetolactate decarboxylase